MPSAKLSHLDQKGHARMVDVSAKPVTDRRAVAEGFITLSPATAAAIAAGTVPKGEVLATARIAGILAAKKCGDLIPLCHPLPVESVAVDFHFPAAVKSPAKTIDLRITAVAAISSKTGVEMEALTAVAVAALTIYDMCKAIDKTMIITGIRLLEKTGGRSSVSPAK